MREEFESVGAVKVAGVLDLARCEALRAVIDACRQTPSPHYGVLSRDGLPRVDSDLFRWSDVPELRALLFDGPLPQLAAALLGTDAVVFVEDQWLASEPDATTASPWHQDGPYYNIDGDFVTIWIALDDAPAATALRVVPGSHEWGDTYAPVEFAASTSTIGAGGTLGPVPPDERLDDASRGWDVRSGDVIALHPMMLHRAGAAPIDRWFRRLSTRWASPAARYVDRGGQAASFWSMLDHGLVDGDRLECEVFPMVMRPR